jgi:MFS family permease
VAQGIWWLFPARIFSGLGIALVSGAATAWIIEAEPGDDNARATQWAIGANFLGLGIGPLLAGTLAQFAPWPLRLCYLIFLALLVPVAFLIWRTKETVARPKSLGETSVRPRLGVPPEIRTQFVSPAVGAFAVFAVLGFYTALVPSLLVQALHNQNHATAGAIVTELFAVGTLAIALTPRLTSHRGLLIALALLLPSLLLLVMAELQRSMGLLLVGTALTGVATGLGYRCSLQKVNEMAAKDQRAEIVSTYLIASYGGISVPVIGVGLLATATTSLFADALFAGIIALMAIAALIVEWKVSPP